MILFSTLLALSSMAADTPQKDPFVKKFSERGPLCVEQKYGCLDAKCEKPVLYESLVSECTRSKHAKKAMGEMAKTWSYMRFDHLHAPQPTPSPQASAIPNLPPVKVPEGMVTAPVQEIKK